MAGYYDRRKSKAAIWCLRLSVLAIPYLVVAVFLHRSGNINSEQIFWLFAFGIAMLITSLLCGLWAAVGLWEKGYKGGSITVNGIMLATVLLAPFGYQLLLAFNNPSLSDLATDVTSPPVFLENTTAGNKQNEYGKFQARTIVTSYPELVSRHYALPATRVSQSVEALLKKWNWQIIASDNVPKKPQANDSELAGTDAEMKKSKKTKKKKLKKKNAAKKSNDKDKDIIFQAKVQSFVMKLKSDVVIRLMPDEGATLVDMRSSSHWGRHDFGSNAKNIKKFFIELDAILAGITVDN